MLQFKNENLTHFRPLSDRFTTYTYSTEYIGIEEPTPNELKLDGIQHEIVIYHLSVTYTYQYPPPQRDDIFETVCGILKIFINISIIKWQAL